MGCREDMRDAGVPAVCVHVMAGLPAAAPEAMRPAARMAAHTLALLSGGGIDLAWQVRAAGGLNHRVRMPFGSPIACNHAHCIRIHAGRHISCCSDISC